jgi:hypothetical protein
MGSADAHQVFDLSFGWLSLLLPQVALAWTGRIITWLLLAWAWRRLSFAVVPRAWWSVLTAALFVLLMDRCNMAGEWVVGGVEAKGIAYVLVFLGLAALVRDRWNSALLLFGAAAAFHVLVGGWAAVAAGIAWLWLKWHRGQGAGKGRREAGERSPPLGSLFTGILGCWLLSLPGLIPSVMLDWGTDADTIRQAHQLYVFERLPHHLVLSGIRPDFILRMALLCGFWVVLSRFSRKAATDENMLTDTNVGPPRSAAIGRLRAFVLGAVVIALAGVAIQPLIWLDRPLAADLLRCYWFRLADVALPLGVALEGIAILVGRRVAGGAVTAVCRESADALGTNECPPQQAPQECPPRRVPRAVRHGALGLAILASAAYLGVRGWERIFPAPPRSHRLDDFDAWHEACQWVAQSGYVPADARFIVPRLSQTFSWYTARSGVVDWKDVPQDAREMVAWWQRIQDVFATGRPPPDHWYRSLAELGEKRLRGLGAKYHAQYVITERIEPLLHLDVVYSNRSYVIYRL